MSRRTACHSVFVAFLFVSSLAFHWHPQDKKQQEKSSWRIAVASRCSTAHLHLAHGWVDANKEV